MGTILSSTVFWSKPASGQDAFDTLPMGEEEAASAAAVEAYFYGYENNRTPLQTYEIQSTVGNCIRHCLKSELINFDVFFLMCVCDCLKHTCA